MKLFIKNVTGFLLLGLIPIVILTIGYLVYDPFKVIYYYKDYSYPFVIPNRDYISTEMLGKNVSKYHYNSFIFGSSRTLAFKPAAWVSHLPPNSSPYMFDASSETVYGIYTKLKYLEAMRIPVNNALIILCRDAAFHFDGNLQEHLFIKDPRTSGESKLAFHLTFYQAYMSSNFLYSFYRYMLSKKVKSYMAGYIEYRKITYDTITNELKIPDQEAEISNDPVGYYERRKKSFYARQHGERMDTSRHINSKNLFMLREMKKLLEKQQTSYKVVISPLYEQVTFHTADMAILKDIFEDHLYDFSGSNSFTNNMYNYYESSHFRPVVGDSIMNIIYKR